MVSLQVYTCNLFKWINDYLSQRQHSVIVGSTRSSSRPVTAGVPQGSVLGPLFFVVYVNHISDDLLSFSRLFADDTSLSCSASSISDIEGIMNHDLAMLSNWSKQQLVSVNPMNTEAILFSNQNVQNPNLVFENVNISFVENHKHLGVTLHKHGNWKDHIANITTLASKILRSMWSLKFYGLTPDYLSSTLSECSQQSITLSLTKCTGQRYNGNAN